MKPLLQNLAELRVQAKHAEDRISRAQSDPKERADETLSRLCKEAEQALEIVQQRVAQSREEVRTRFEPMHAKLNSDFDRLRRQASEKRQKLELWQAKNQADDKEIEALAAIDYAIATTKIAELQTLDAIRARAEAKEQIEGTRSDQPITA
jgi:hypothetical protein